MFSENLDVFLADFSVPCSKGATPFLAILDTPDESLGIGIANAMSTMYEIRVKTSDVQLTNLLGGDSITVNGVNYKVRDTMLMDDGAFTRVTLTRI
jgi:hypothetical protein